jgi:hypothetical protein
VKHRCGRPPTLYRREVTISQHFDAYYYYFSGVLQHLTVCPALHELSLSHVHVAYYQFLRSQLTLPGASAPRAYFWKSANFSFLILTSFRYFMNADVELSRYHLFQLFFWLNMHATRGCCVYVGKPCRGQRTHTNAKSAFYVLPRLKLFVQKLKLLNKLERRALAKHWTPREIKRLRVDKRLQKIDLKVKKKHAKPHKLAIKKKSKSIWS